MVGFLALVCVYASVLAFLTTTSKDTGIRAMGYVAFALGVVIAGVAFSAELHGMLLAWALGVI